MIFSTMANGQTLPPDSHLSQLESDLRDHFAGIALGAMIGNTDKNHSLRGSAGVRPFAKFAYQYADAMMEARKQ